MKNYYYIDTNGQQAGPVMADELIQHGVTADTFVWREGMSNWEKASTVSELKSLFVQTPPPIPPFSPQPQPQSQPQSQPQPKSQQNYSNDHGSKYEPVPDNNLVLAIVSTILCCWPVGLVAIIHATKVEKLWHSGQKELAKAKAEEAKNWAIGSIVLGVVVFVLYFFIMLFSAL